MGPKFGRICLRYSLPHERLMYSDKLQIKLFQSFNALMRFSHTLNCAFLLEQSIDRLIC